MSLQNSGSDFTYKKFNTHLFVLCASQCILLLLYFIAPKSFFTISQSLITCLGFSLMISSYYSKYIAQNILLSSLSFFYGLINFFHLFQIIGLDLLNSNLSSFFLSIKTYYVGRISFAIALVFITYTYVHKKSQLNKVVHLLLLFIMAFLTLSFFIFTEDFIIFVRSHSLGALFFNLLNLIITPTALIFAYLKLSQIKDDIPIIHKKIFLFVLTCSVIMESIDLLYFIPLTAPPVYSVFFKLITLSLLVIGQIHACILQPFEEIFLKRKEAEELITSNTYEFSQYSSQVQQLEAILHSQSAQYQKLISIFPEPFIVCIDSIIYQMNRAALDLFQVKTANEFIGTNILSYIVDAPHLPTEYASLLSHQGKIIEGEGKLLLPNNACYTIEYLFTSNAFYTSDTVICILRDTTLKYETQHAQQALFNQQLKLRYFSSISHDIKTPINIIYSALQMQTHSSTLPECLHYTDMMHKGCLKLLKLLNNLLDLTKIDNKMFSVAPQIFNIVDAIESLCEISSYYMASKEISYIFDTDTDEKLVSLDPLLLERVILNLLSNAIKYTASKGHISVCIHDSDTFITIHIKDTGVGIPPHQIDTIFNRYTMLNDNDGRREHSAGMGLSIVNDLLSLMNATITCESTLGHGSEFIIKLPTPSYSDVMIQERYNVNYSSQNIKIEFCDI